MSFSHIIGRKSENVMRDEIKREKKHEKSKKHEFLCKKALRNVFQFHNYLLDDKDFQKAAESVRKDTLYDIETVFFECIKILAAKFKNVIDDERLNDIKLLL